MSKGEKIHTSAWVFSSKLAAYFEASAIEDCFCKMLVLKFQCTKNEVFH